MTPRRAPEAGPLTAEAIIAATEDVLRRYGPAKATVVDVARALNVSHGSVYRHFASKTELREAVARGWLARVTAGLADIAASDRPAPERLHDWLRELAVIKRRKVLDDPEMFATYSALIPGDSPVAADHLAYLAGQVARILADGMASGEFRAADPPTTARAVLDATSRFHAPAHAREWTSPTIDDEFEAVVALLLAGLA
ncbi:MAG TPA: TetR family transcriptional regulator [Streptosporangiaceae bacterium]|jgi:AcrR family transcriptional regulator